MDRGASSDVFFLTDEKFDFDVSLSPASSTGEDLEDEVFVGPVGHTDRCISANVASRVQNVRTSWSPLTGDQLEAICEEAQKVANELQSSEHAQTDNANSSCVMEKNEFVQGSEAKLSMLGNLPTVLSPIKRQTFCIQDSPLKRLPPAIQNRLMKGRSPNVNGQATKSTTRPTGKTQPNQQRSTNAPRSLASPGSVPKTQAKPALRGKTGIGVSVVLPSRPMAPTASRSTTKNPADKSRLQPPSKMSAGSRRSPNSSRSGSCEDLLSDSASVTSDVSDTSLNSSYGGKRSLAPPTTNVRAQSGVKPPCSESGRRLPDRRKTSSSSSSVSSFNSSISLSPAPKGKPNSLSKTSGPAPNSLTKPTDQKRRRSCKPSDQPLPAAGRRSLSVQNRKPSQPELPKPARATPLTRLGASPGHNTPVRKGLVKTKPQALVPPIPNGTLRGSSSPDDTKMFKLKRLVSTKSVDSLPQKSSLSALTPSGGSSGVLPMKARRPSALPTPLRSRLSGLPQPTPSSQIRPIRPLPNYCAPSSPTPTESPDSLDVPVIQPFNLEEEEPVQGPPTIALSDQSQTTITIQSPPESTSQSESRKEKHQELTVETISKAQEILLLDLPAPAPQPQEKLLIDLTNTPDLIRTKTCPSAKELIDLSSPLIKWSPVVKKEEAPLINLSF